MYLNSLLPANNKLKLIIYWIPDLDSDIVSDLLIISFKYTIQQQVGACIILYQSYNHNTELYNENGIIMLHS